MRQAYMLCIVLRLKDVTMKIQLRPWKTLNLWVYCLHLTNVTYNCSWNLIDKQLLWVYTFELRKLISTCRFRKHEWKHLRQGVHQARVWRDVTGQGGGGYGGGDTRIRRWRGCEDLDGEVICDGEAAMLKKKPPEQDGEVCSIFESPFRIFKVREFKPKFSFIPSLNYFMKEEI